MDHFGPGFIILLIVLGWVWKGIKALSRASVQPAARVSDREQVQGAVRPPPPPVRAAPPAPPWAAPPMQPTRPVAARAPGPTISLEPAPAPTRAAAFLLGDQASVRHAIIAAEILGPPVALR